MGSGMQIFGSMLGADARQVAINPAACDARMQACGTRQNGVGKLRLLISSDARRYQQASSLCKIQVTGRLRLCTAQEPGDWWGLLFAGWVGCVAGDFLTSPR